MIISAEDIRVEKHIVGTTAYDMKDFSAPLRRQFNIDHFSYVKLWPGNKESHLTTDPGFADMFYKNRMYKTAGIGEPSKYKQCNVLGDHDQHELVIRAAKEFHLYHPFYLVRPGIGFCEIFVFGTSIQNPAINNFYINNLDLLEVFTQYFKHTASDLIQQADNNIISFPGICEDALILSHVNDIKEVDIRNQEFKNLAFNDSVNIDELLSERKRSNNLHLTKKALSMRERQCAYLLLDGLTAKECANILQISHRTVEVYIERLKKRLNCKNKAGLIRVLTELNFKLGNQNAFLEDQK